MYTLVKEKKPVQTTIYLEDCIKQKNLYYGFEGLSNKKFFLTKAHKGYNWNTFELSTYDLPCRDKYTTIPDALNDIKFNIVVFQTKEELIKWLQSEEEKLPWE